MFDSKLFIIFFFISTYFGYSQVDVSSVLPIRNLYSKHKNVDNEKDYVITSKDTLYSKSQKLKNLDHLKAGTYDVQTMNTYLNSVFPPEYRSCIKTSYLNQWTSPIIVYFDKDIPRNIIKSIKAFYKDISVIKNFNLTFTKNINEANYLVKLTQKEIKKKSVCFPFDYIENEERFVFNNCTYTLIPDSNYNNISCILEVSDTLLSNYNLLLSTIKQSLFLSFCHFFPDHYLDDDSSFLSSRYKNQNTLSQFDFDLLKIHYTTIYNCKIERQTLIDLYNLVN